MLSGVWFHLFIVSLELYTARETTGLINDAKCVLIICDILNKQDWNVIFMCPHSGTRDLLFVYSGK